MWKEAVKEGRDLEGGLGALRGLHAGPGTKALPPDQAITSKAFGKQGLSSASVNHVGMSDLF